MSKPTVPVKGKTPTLLQEFEELQDRITRRAFELFLGRGGAFGRDLEDWFRAEQEMVLPPPIEIADAGKNVSVRVALPGFKAEDVEVFADARSITIKAEHTEKSEPAEKTVHYSEFRSGRVLREFELPAEIAPERATAEIRDGILILTLPKAEASQKKIEVQSVSKSSG